MNLASMAIALMLLPPPPPPPNPARLAEAVSIWRDHPFDSEYMNRYARFSIGQRINFMLTAARVRQGGRQWLAKSRLLDDYFWSRISPAIQDNEQPFLECLASRYAWMSIEEIRALRQFLSTPAGSRFWTLSDTSDTDGARCAVDVFGDDIDRVEGGAWTLIGARRPPPPLPVD